MKVQIAGPAGRLVGFLSTGLVVLIAMSAAAQAEVLFLKCGEFDIITVDLTKSTVAGIPARITPLSINWDPPGDFPVHDHIDRSAGTMRTVFKRTDVTETCTAVSQPETKF